MASLPATQDISQEHACQESTELEYPPNKCTGNVVLSEPLLITSKGKFITYTGVVEGKYE